MRIVRLRQGFTTTLRSNWLNTLDIKGANGNSMIEGS